MSVRSTAALVIRIAGTCVVLSMLALTIRLTSINDTLKEPVLAEREARQPVWADRLNEWMISPELRAIASADAVIGNAADILWPGGLGGKALHCPSFRALGPGHDAWTEQRERWLTAADCEVIDEFVRASNMSYLDVLSVSKQEDSGSLIFENAHHFGIRSGIEAMIARAYRDSEIGEIESAEAMLVAALRLSLLLIRHDGTLAGMETGHRKLPVVLQHLAALRRDQDRPDEAEHLEMLGSGVPPFESCTGLLNYGLARTGRADAGLGFIRAAATDPNYPLAIRVRAALIISDGYVSTPAGLAFGPSRYRREIFRDLSRDAELAPWVRRIEGLERAGVRQRAAALVELALAGPSRL